MSYYTTAINQSIDHRTIYQDKTLSTIYQDKAQSPIDSDVQTCYESDHDSLISAHVSATPLNSRSTLVNGFQSTYTQNHYQYQQLIPPSSLYGQYPPIQHFTEAPYSLDYYLPVYQTDHYTTSFPPKTRTSYERIQDILDGGEIDIPLHLYYFCDEIGIQDLTKLIYKNILKINQPFQAVQGYQRQTEEDIEIELKDTLIITSYDFQGNVFGKNLTKQSQGKFPLKCIQLDIELQTQINLIFYSTTMTLKDIPKVFQYCQQEFPEYFKFCMLNELNLKPDRYDQFIVYGHPSFQLGIQKFLGKVVKPSQTHIMN
ncbi:hypothetical protein HDV02_003511 [Globomyces sp. JEL0801]|nr:hypothetical protein HDV02_003511 [Globomyces sp. JEL0801]